MEDIGGADGPASANEQVKSGLSMVSFLGSTPNFDKAMDEREADDCLDMLYVL